MLRFLHIFAISEALYAKLYSEILTEFLNKRVFLCRLCEIAFAIL